MIKVREPICGTSVRRYCAFDLMQVMVVINNLLIMTSICFWLFNIVHVGNLVFRNTNYLRCRERLGYVFKIAKPLLYLDIRVF